MAILKDGKYFKIFGYEVDIFRTNVAYRVAVYDSKNMRDTGADKYGRTVEFKVHFQNIIQSKLNEAEKHVMERENIGAETKAAIEMKNSQLKEIGKPELTEKQEKEERDLVIARLITARAKSLAEGQIDGFLNLLVDGGEKRNILQVGYEYLHLLPEFKGCKKT